MSSSANSTEASGCIVILEPGASWPERAFASVPHRDGVVVVNESPEEAPEHFFKRLARQIAHVTANGVLVRSVLVACTITSAGHPVDRTMLAVHVQRNILDASNGSVTFVTGDELPL
jgi:hypothetical protein